VSRSIEQAYQITPAKLQHFRFLGTVGEAEGRMAKSGIVFVEDGSSSLESTIT